MSELDPDIATGNESDPSTIAKGDGPSPRSGEVKDSRKQVVRVRAGTLAAALKDVGDVVEGRNTIPILGNVLLRVCKATRTSIELTATDLDLWVVRELVCEPLDKAERAFALTLPIKSLAAVIGELDPDATVTIAAPSGDDSRATISAGRSRFRLPVLPAANFPLPPAFAVAASVEMACSALGDAFAAVEHAISTEETRYYLNGIYVHCVQTPGASPALCLVAIDGHRLARLWLDPPDGALVLPSAIWARKTVGILDKLLAGAGKGLADNAAPPQVSIEATEGPCPRLRFAMPAGGDKDRGGGSIELVCKTIDGDFPDYTRVIPSDPPLCAMIGRAALAEAVKRVAVLADNKSRAVAATFANDVLTLRVVSAELGEASEELPCSYSGAAGEEVGPLTIGFDAKYWRDALGALASDTVAMGMSDAGAPCRIRAVDGDSEQSDRLVQVLMPVRV